MSCVRMMFPGFVCGANKAGRERGVGPFTETTSDLGVGKIEPAGWADCQPFVRKPLNRAQERGERLFLGDFRAKNALPLACRAPKRGGHVSACDVSGYLAVRSAHRLPESAPAAVGPNQPRQGELKGAR
jgi:hypothetical protein